MGVHSEKTRRRDRFGVGAATCGRPLNPRRQDACATNAGRGERGAALIIALGMLTLLLVIALTFYRASRDDVRTADNAVNAVRAELLADGATAVAIAFINADHRAHPSFTSLDFAWRTYFNGAWMAGKPWLWAPMRDPETDPSQPNFALIHPLSPLRGGVPELNLSLRADEFNGAEFEFADIYIPRVVLNVLQDAGTYATIGAGPLEHNPFVYTTDIADPADATFRRFSPMEALTNGLFGTFTFQDDLDALEARVYDDLASPFRVVSLLETPLAAGAVNRTLPAEQIHFWTDVDNDGDGLRDAMWLPMPADRYFPEDGLDNDLDGFIDEFDLDGEPGVFLYRGDLDGIDNDDDGDVDEIVAGIADEARFVIFTLPTPFMLPDGTVLTPADLSTYYTAMGIDTSNDTVLFEGIDTIGNDGDGNPITSRDNDYDLVVDDHVDSSQYMLTETAVRALVQGDPALNPYYNLLLAIVGQARLDEYIDEFNLDVNVNNARGRLAPLGAIRGENVTEIAGRFAVTITDESSKINLNAAGGLTYIPDASLPPFPMARAFNQGVGPHELELRVLPDIGAARYPRIWTYRMGATDGNALSPVFYNNVLDPAATYAELPDNQVFDVSLPGYGRVDDDGNLLQLALNRIDDSGVRLIESESISLNFEGLDEPGEFQRFRPYRNREAEADVIDNDIDDIDDEIGELGDRFYRTHHELKLIGSIAAGVFGDVRNLVTSHSFDRNERHLHINATQASYRATPGRLTTGLRKDLNVARPDQVARAVMRDWTYTPSELQLREDFGAAMGDLATDPSPGVGPIVTAFLAGLRQENTSVFTDQAILSAPAPDTGFATTLLADPQLRAHQVAASIKDYADLDSTRSDDEVFVEDTWWQANAVEAEDDPSTPENEALIADIRRIKYNVAGIERIRINEVNVRPVRRVEAESTTEIGGAGYELGFDPNRFVPRSAGLTPEQIEEQGFRLRTRTTVDEINEFTGAPLIIDTTDFENSWARFEQLGLLGLGAAWTTYRSYLTVTDLSDPANPREFLVPDVIQFSFQATEELPTGRYYLAMNHQYIDDILSPEQYQLIDSIERSSDVSFAVKIGALNDDWFTDLVNIEAYVQSNRTYGQAWRSPAVIGSDDLGGSGGMAFLQGRAVFRANNIGSGTQSLTPEQFRANNSLEPNFGFTIEVPPRIGGDPDEDLWVHVAIQGRQEDGEVTAVNYFEFSQEPDHEWVEIVNLDTENEVDLSGWQLAIENHPLGIGPMTIPFGTTIAPGGMLLLCANKFDYGFNTDFDEDDPLAVIPGDVSNQDDPDLFDRRSGFFTNGIGLASYVLPASLNGPAPSPPNMVPFIPITVPRSYYLFADDTQGSVFQGFLTDRTVVPVPGGNFVDYVERDGDGSFTNTAAEMGGDDVIASTPFSTIPGIELISSPTLLDTLAVDEAEKPWDRIVELVIPDLLPQNDQLDPTDPQFMAGAFTAADIGRIVLGGGIFPNRPEFDLRDNDGDNAELLRDEIDNDLDGEIDEADEGFDEGRIARDERILREFVLGAVRPSVPGGFNTTAVRYLTSFFDFDPFGPDQLPGYWDPVQNPPQWKEFIERRNFPGDNVIVTLYEGDAADGQVADRVTYNQRDVDNRAIDDVLQVTDADTDGLGEQLIADSPIPLSNALLSLWPDNTMGVDFARSMERRLPTYTGDRFGLSNRFEATDGNYDDWADSTGRWAHDVTLNADGDWQSITGVLDRYAAAANVYRMIVHAVSGTPLRANAPTRLTLQVDSVNPGLTFGDAQASNVYALAEFPNRPLVSPGEAMLMPYTSRRERLDTIPAAGTSYLMDLDSPNTRNVATGTADLPVGDFSYDAITLGQRLDGNRSPLNFFADARSFVGDIGTTDSVSLNVGQANVVQMQRGNVNPDPTFPWNPVTGLPPETWSPLLSFELAGTLGVDDADFDFDAFDVHPAGTVWPYGYERQYLFQQPSAGVVPATVDNARSPTHDRAVLYASRNFVDFPIDQFDGAAAVFVWDGDDGVENGEYDLYVVTTEDLDALTRTDEELFFDDPNDPSDPFGQRLLTQFASATPNLNTGLVHTIRGTANREVFLDIEVFRDVDADRKAWNANLLPGDFLNNNSMNRGQTVDRPYESFGQITAAQPDPDGMIHYGVVRVENNFLAVLVRNRSEAGKIARISRVILASRNKNPGRLNINTVETTRISLDNVNDTEPNVRAQDYYNPLQTLPGVLALRTLDQVAIAQLPPQITRVIENFDDNDLGPTTIRADILPSSKVIPLGPISITPPGPPNRTPDQHAHMLVNQIMDQRLRISEQPDGRYYEVTSDLLADAHFTSADNFDGLPALRPALVLDDSRYLLDTLGGPDGVADGTGNELFRAAAIEEAVFRFRKMHNLITTQASVYEILVTAQTGYGVDENGDGRINWRDDSEFRVTGEKTARTIYER